jgi:hypothetical protein
MSWLVAPSAARREICASLGGQVVARVDGPFAGALAGRLELDPRALGERLHAELRERFVAMAACRRRGLRGFPLRTTRRVIRSPRVAATVDAHFSQGAA